ncbi:MAG: LamG domain-containing protein, partial [Armatimonadota bacterium]
ANPALSLTQAITVECWVKTDLAGQDNNWLVNRVYSGGTDTGYRLGILNGAPCFEVPQTSFSHHLKADKPLPTGRWVHLAGTFDGQTIRVYMEGELRGTMDRPGPLKPSNLPLTLGSYEAGHPAFFTGLLDEVKLWNRALTAEEILEHSHVAGAR